MKVFHIGIDLGGSSAKGVSATPEGVILEQIQETFDPAVPMDFARAVASLRSKLESSCQGTAASIGLSAPGLAALDGASIAFMPGRLQGLQGLNWGRYLGRNDPVPILNDAQAALLGEVWLGAAQGSRNVFMLTLGTGVGGAAMVDGHLLKGASGRAGHLGHISLDADGPPDVCGAPGSLEWAIGNASILDRTGGAYATTHDLITAAQSGNRSAKVYWMTSVRRLAAAVASLINVLDPDTVIIGGGIAKAGDALFIPLSQYLDAFEWRPGGATATILPAQLGEFAGALGAARHSMVDRPRLSSS